MSEGLESTCATTSTLGSPLNDTCNACNPSMGLDVSLHMATFQIFGILKSLSRALGAKDAAAIYQIVCSRHDFCIGPLWLRRVSADSQERFSSILSRSATIYFRLNKSPRRTRRKECIPAADGGTRTNSLWSSRSSVQISSPDFHHGELRFQPTHLNCGFCCLTISVIRTTSSASALWIGNGMPLRNASCSRLASSIST